MKKLTRTLAALAFASASLFALAPAAQANQCQDPTDGSWCALQAKLCAYGSSLEEKYGVGWSCTH